MAYLNLWITGESDGFGNGGSCLSAQSRTAGINPFVGENEHTLPSSSGDARRTRKAASSFGFSQHLLCTCLFIFIAGSNSPALMCRQNTFTKCLRDHLYTCVVFGASSVAVLASATLIASGIGRACPGPLRGPGLALRHLHGECMGKDFALRVGLRSARRFQRFFNPLLQTAPFH
jgi:hypothetical protein